jgi:hypothetical protein
MNLNLEKYIAVAKKIAVAHGVQWSIPLNAQGMAIEKSAWDLTLIAKASTPPTVWLNDLGTDRVTVEFLNSETTPGPVRQYKKCALSTDWQDLIKASIIDHILVRKNAPASALGSVARPLRVLATCCGKCNPAKVTSEDVVLAMQVARNVWKCGKLTDLICGVVRFLLDANHLTDAGPLFPLVPRDKRVDKRAVSFVKAQAQLCDDLEERKRAERLPERRAFWELARIVFTEQPKSFLDALRFAIIKLMILTGMRDGEVVTIPADWKRVVEYVDDCNRSASDSGGISREVKLRYFGEKQRIINRDSNVLFETSMTFHLRFAEIIENTLDEVRRITEPLRRTLEMQIASGRILPQFHPDSLVPATDLYTILSGNPFVLKLNSDLRRKFEQLYKKSFDPSVLREIRDLQLERVRLGKGLISSVRNFLERMEGVPVRDLSGSEIHFAALPRGKWRTAYYRVGDVENYIREKTTTKLSDYVPFRLAKGELQIYELLFLMPKRALCDTKEGGICDITQYFSIGRFDSQMISQSLSKGRATSLFSVYGKTEEDQKLGLRPYSLRHLMNNELFRLAVADTIITKRFNRTSTAQSYEYDHRSLLEDLDRIALPAEIEAQLSEKSATLARLVKSGRARGPIVDQFAKMQRQHGELVAIQYLSTEGPGFHPTPYGDCIRDLMTNPCRTHVECFNGCKNLVATDLDANNQNLLQLQARLEIAVSALEKRLACIQDERRRKLSSNSVENLVEPTSLTNSSGSIESRVATNTGVENQLAHAKVRLAGVKKLLATPLGQLVFPDGKDLYAAATSRRETVLDTFRQ